MLYNIKASIHYIWKLFLIVYVILITTSFVYRILHNDAIVYSPKLKVDSNLNTLLYFADPATENQLLINQLETTFSVVHVPIITDSVFSVYELALKAKSIVDSLKIVEFHVFGEGVSGPIALQFASTYQEQTQSLILINSNGILELELLGDYHLNHAFYGAKLTLLKTIDFLIPHFGTLSKIDKIKSSTQIQFNLDQRNIKHIISRVDVPVLIMHTNNSKFTNHISKEIARLIPQSLLINYEEGVNPEFGDVINFINEINSTNFQLSINDSRIEQSLEPFDMSNVLKVEGKTLIVLMVILILSTLVSEDLTCIGAGLLISRGLVGFLPAVFACLIGIFLGDILLFLAGRWLASTTLQKAPLKWFLSENDIRKSTKWFESKGPIIILASRFIPGTRFPTYFTAGAIGASFGMFILYFGLASLIWTPTLVGLSVFLGKQLIFYFNLYHEYAIWITLGFISSFFFLFKVLLPLFTKKGRSMFIGKFNRIRNSEFWPPYILYGFVSIYIISRWIKYKNVTLFALSNPSIPEGGFIKESKIAILNEIHAYENIANCELINGHLSFEEKLHRIEFFMRSNNLNFPIVLKPNVGERGKGVNIPKNSKELKSAIYEITSDYIIQEFIEGEEYGVFYYRFPNQQNGQILSITKKVYLKLIGDGKQTLEELILNDSRAVCMANLHFDRYLDKLYSIPRFGERIQLVELGTHARGAKFLDGSEFISDVLTEEMDRISKSFEGFYFGRYDIKVPNEHDLKNGKNIKVIELNGVTSESTNIYDPKHSFFFGVKTLCKQWGIAYEIGYQIQQKYPNYSTPTITHLLSLLN